MYTAFTRHPIVYGIVGGLSWGAVMRLWMRFISSDPEFSWGGTGFILGASTIVGMAMGVAWLRRSKGGSGWWRLWGFSSLLVGAGAGAVMMPSVMLGAMALGRSRWRSWARVALAGAAIAFQVWFFLSDGEAFPGWKNIPAYTLYSLMITLEAFAVSVIFRPPVKEATAPRAFEKVAVSVGVVVMVGLGSLLVGVSG